MIVNIADTMGSPKMGSRRGIRRFDRLEHKRPNTVVTLCYFISVALLLEDDSPDTLLAARILLRIEESPKRRHQTQTKQCTHGKVGKSDKLYKGKSTTESELY